MKLQVSEPPREFIVGFGPPVHMKDCAHLALEPDEQVTFTTESGAEYDVARKNWGFYATPSINGRLARFGLRTSLVRNRQGQYFLLLVEAGKEQQFEEYLGEEGLHLCGWLNEQTLGRVAAALAAAK